MFRLPELRNSPLDYSLSVNKNLAIANRPRDLAAHTIRWGHL